MTNTLGFSTCPNDTFIFDALVNSRLENSEVPSVYLSDVEELNKLAFEARLDITKLSFGVYPDVSENYQILDSGSALGFGCGPIKIKTWNYHQFQIILKWLYQVRKQQLIFCCQ